MSLTALARFILGAEDILDNGMSILHEVELVLLIIKPLGTCIISIVILTRSIGFLEVLVYFVPWMLDFKDQILQS